MTRSLFALAVALPIAAFAQPRPDPADPKAAVPPLRHESALGTYRPFQDEGPAPWKQVNEEVKGKAGHAAHSAPKKEPVPTTKKPAQPHKH